MPPYNQFGNEHDLQTSVMIAKTGISLPSAVNLSELEAKHITNVIVDFINSYEIQ